MFRPCTHGKNISSILICYTKHNIRSFSSAGSVALALQARGRRFESHRDHKIKVPRELSWLERVLQTDEVVGSNPTLGTKKNIQI